MLSFEELTDARRSLQSFCHLHEPSLLRLQSGLSFKLHPTEGNLGTEKIRHLTTTATCLTSLIDCPLGFQTSNFERVKNLRSVFVEKALARKDWESEDSAGIYCRCRALPAVVDLSVVDRPDSLDKRIEGHLEVILGQLKIRPERFGIGEAEPKEPPKREEEGWYPPNAFHTYWTLNILDCIKRKDEATYTRLSKREALDLAQRRSAMLLWSRQELGSQLGLHSASPQSSMLDSDQLAWSLAVFLRFDDATTVNLENRDFIKQSLKCLFSTQTDGTWRHYKPLFHYLDVGNAYCYVFETFAALLESSLRDGDKAEMIRELLKPYSKNLMDLWRYAESTKIDLREYGAPKTAGQEVGWCSGHKTNLTEPESWATASVFSYAQALRRLIGLWCREEALRVLNTPRSRSTPKSAAEEIVKRGRTWESDTISVSEQLRTMFINPALMHDCKDKLEPDNQPIEKKQARSAILFGPPGTSKTTLVTLLADVIGWNYIELHASHFVAEGLTQVQKTADRIFKQLQELDHAVVLFDEIDELVREREMEEDAFGRFLTTSMLPKLAELWKARKILYFVATNHINYFDSAIIRSHRFDALILVRPPSFEAKKERLWELLPEKYSEATFHPDVEKKVNETFAELLKSAPGKPKWYQLGADADESYKEWQERKIDPSFALAKYLLLRYDELDELAYQLSKTMKNEGVIPEVISVETLRLALTEIADSQWRKNKSYVDYERDEKSERRDYQMLKTWQVLAESVNGPTPGATIRGDQTWLSKAVDSPSDIEIEGRLVQEASGGVLIVSDSPEERESQEFTSA
jgi:hypothetical protein